MSLKFVVFKRMAKDSEKEEDGDCY
jgi:hypothetical protein